MTMLVWLSNNAGLILFRKTLISNSIPTTNINKIKPIWLRNCRFPKDSTGKSAAENSGKYIPKSEGPSTMPAAISPITVGCPILVKIQPKTLTTIMITTICASKTASGCSKLCVSPSKNSCHWLPLLCGTIILRPNSSVFP